MVPSLRLETAILNYDINKCFCGFYNHRIDVKQGSSGHQLNCCTLAKYFPFVRRVQSKFDKRVSLEILMIDDRPIHLSRVAMDSGQVLESYNLQLLRKQDDSKASSKLLRRNDPDTDTSSAQLKYSFHSSESVVHAPTGGLDY